MKFLIALILISGFNLSPVWYFVAAGFLIFDLVLAGYRE